MPTRLGSFVVVLAILLAAALGIRSELASSAEGLQEPTMSADELKHNFLAEHEIGRRFSVDPADLPPPKTGAIVTNRSLILPYNGQIPQVPPGFTPLPFATGLANPPRLLVLPNGDVLLAEQSAGYLTLLRDASGSGPHANELTLE